MTNAPIASRSELKPEDLRDYRVSLAATVLARLSPTLPHVAAHFGEDYENTEIPEALVYTRTGGTFRFLAFSCAPWRMWDLHIGVVPQSATQLSVGLHISERASKSLMQELERFASEKKLNLVHVEAAVEFQVNWPTFDLSVTAPAEVARTVENLCQTLGEIAARNKPAKEMSDGSQG